MTVHCLYDSRQIEKFGPLLDELARQGINSFRIISPVEDSNSVIRSINLSHKAIIREAKHLNYPEIAVWEEDCQISHPEGWKHFLANKPDNFDIYLGGTYGLGRPVINPISQINGFHCYIMRSSFYDRFLSIPDDVHCDTALDGMGLFYVHYPFIALQRPGWSATSREEYSNKNADLTDADVYGGLPK